MFDEGKFLLHSGQVSDWRINLDGLSKAELGVLAKLIAERVGDFDIVVGPDSHYGSCVPRLVDAVSRLVRRATHPKPWIVLVIDDVLSTGKSVTELRAQYENEDCVVKGAVVFARSNCPDWVMPVFMLSEPLRV